MQPLDLIKTARRLSSPRGSKKPRQSDLKRAVSTAYYAMFHAMCRNCADCLIGKTKALRSEPAWRQAYRAVEHSHAKNQCKNKAILAKFPQDIQHFAGYLLRCRKSAMRRITTLSPGLTSSTPIKWLIVRNGR